VIPGFAFAMTRMYPPAWLSDLVLQEMSLAPQPCSTGSRLPPPVSTPEPAPSSEPLPVPVLVPLFVA